MGVTMVQIGDSLWIRGGILEPVLLSFGKLYEQEQASLDPLYGLKEYGPYRPVDIKILHLIPKEWKSQISDEIIEIFEQQIQDILRRFLSRKNHTVSIERESITEISSFRASDPDKKIYEELINIAKGCRDNCVIVIPLLKNVVGHSVGDRIYATIKRIGLKEGFVTQIYTDLNVINPIKRVLMKKQALSLKSWNAVLLNLSLNILAKGGGIPWALHDNVEYDIVLGISWGIRRLTESATGPTSKCYGIVHTFSNIGIWENFNAFASETKEESILMALKTILEEILPQNGKTELGRRILILTREKLKRSFYQKLFNKILSREDKLDVVFISSSPNIRLYSILDSYIAPRGLYTIFSNDEAVLVTTGITYQEKYYGMGVPKPIEIIRLFSTDNTPITKIVQAVFFFTAMSWRTFWGKLRLPTPIYYSKLVANLFSNLNTLEIDESFYVYKTYIYKPYSENIRDKPWFL